MQRTPQFGIVTALYNGGRWIGETLDSVASQEDGDWEHVVVDDGSADNGPEIVAARARVDPRVRLIRQDREGPAAARNLGANATQARWLIFLDKDDLLPSDRLATDRRAGTGDAQVVAGPVTWVDSGGSVLHPAVISGDIEANLWRQRFYVVFFFSGLTLRSEWFHGAGAFTRKPGFQTVEDFEFTQRMLRTPHIRQVPSERLRYRIHATNRTRSVADTAPHQAIQVLQADWSELDPATHQALPECSRFWPPSPNAFGLADLATVCAAFPQMRRSHLVRRPDAGEAILRQWRQTLAVRIREAGLPAADERRILLGERSRWGLRTELELRVRLWRMRRRKE